jgi:hypothetical protein
MSMHGALAKRWFRFLDDGDEPLQRRLRYVINEKSFEEQRVAGLAKLREYGVLK